MTKKRKNREKELEDFLRYTQDKMSEEERNAFERSLQQHPFDGEALEGLSSISPEEARADLAGLQDKLRKRITLPQQTTGKTRTLWYRMAAAIAVLLVVTSVLFTLFNDRMGQMDRKVAESPEAEKEAPAAAVENAPVEPSLELTPAESKVEDKKTAQVKPVVAETEPESEEEAPAREELADKQIERAPDFKAAELDVEEAVHLKEVAAKSRKRETAEQLQMAGAAAGPQRTLSGVVISGEDEQPLPGVIVAVKGSNTGTVTDPEGKFQLSIEDDSQNTLITRFIGMEPKEIPVGDEDELRITLEPDATSLQEVVVTQPAGYSVDNEGQKTQGYRSAIPVCGTKEFNEYIINNMRFPDNENVLTRAVVVLNFVVGIDGRPAQVSVLKSPGKAFSDEAIRLLLHGPDWEPAEKDGKYYQELNRVRIVFQKGEGPS
jgi:hypothetical protein